MKNKIDFKNYSEFVFTLTSDTSKSLASMMSRLDELDANFDSEKQKHNPDINVPLFLTSAMGMCSEAGEFMEITKKCLWQGKPLTDEVKFHLMRELGDQMFYWIQACIALGFDPNEVIAENVLKLQNRYPGGEFDVYHSENRRPGDL